MKYNNQTVPRALLAALALVAVSLPAHATIVFNGSGAASNTFQQTMDRPCVIADNSCKEPTGFTDTQNTGPGDYDLMSPIYTAITTFTSYAGNDIEINFSLGIDSNVATGQGPQVLQFFKTYVCNPTCVLDVANSYLTPTALPNNNNGNGFSDAVLTGFSLTGGVHYEFEASVTNQTDGMEQFFIIPAGAAPIPEPMTIGMVGAGLLGLGLLRRRKGRENQSNLKA